MIEKVFIISMIVWAVWICMQSEMIFEKLGVWLQEHLDKWFGKELGEYIGKPVFSCPICMSFWYGSLAYWIIWGESTKQWLIVVVGVIGLNTILSKLMPEK